MQKLILAFFSLFFIYGCGVASKDVVTESKPLSNIQVYALTDKGISISDNNGNTWAKLIQKTRTNNLASSLMNDLAFFQNTLIIATEHGLSVTSANAYVNYLEDSNVHKILAQGTELYAATNTGVYACTANYQWSQLSPTATTTIAIHNNTLYAGQQKTIQAIPLNSSGNVLEKKVSDNILAIATQGNNIVTLTNKSLYINGSLNDTLGAQNCTALFVDAKKNIWVTCDLGLAKSNDGKTWLIFDNNNGLPKTTINSIYADNLNIYLATETGLIQSVNGGETWKTYQRQHGLVSSKVLKVLVIK